MNPILPADVTEVLYRGSVSFAETQLTATLPVLEAARSLRDGLSEGYQAVKRLEVDPAKTDDSYDKVEKLLLKLWGRWPPLHTAMRVDLGVGDLCTFII